MKKYGLFSLLATLLCIHEPISAQEGCIPEMNSCIHESIVTFSMEDEDLILEPVNWKHLDDYMQLFGDAETVKKYADGRIWTLEEMQGRFSEWTKRWETGDFFSAFAVYLKQEKKTFIGHIVLGHGPYQGQAELAFLFKPEALAQGFATQAVSMILYDYAKELILDQALTNLGIEVCEPAPLQMVHAVVRLDHPYAAQALRQAGMRRGAVETIWGARRVHYTISSEEILSNDR